MTDRPAPDVGPDNVLAEVHKTGICCTNVHICNWDEWAANTVPRRSPTQYADEISVPAPM